MESSDQCRSTAYNKSEQAVSDSDQFFNIQLQADANNESYLLLATADNSTCFNTMVPYASDPQSTMNVTYDHQDCYTCVDDSQRLKM